MRCNVWTYDSSCHHWCNTGMEVLSPLLVITPEFTMQRLEIFILPYSVDPSRLGKRLADQVCGTPEKPCADAWEIISDFDRGRISYSAVSLYVEFLKEWWAKFLESNNEYGIIS